MERNVLEDFRDRIRWRIDNMPLDERVSSRRRRRPRPVQPADLMDTVQHEGEDHECVDGCVPVYYHQQTPALASRRGSVSIPPPLTCGRTSPPAFATSTSDHLSSHMEERSGLS